MTITKQQVAGKIAAYLRHEIALPDLVDWSEQALTRRAWWLAKIEGNKARDRRQTRLLRKNGWTVVRIWQHELEPKHVQKALRKLRVASLQDF